MPTATRYNFTELRTQMPLAFPGQRIGLMGGTFNPPHEGHAVCAVTALRRLQLDQLWWMVTPGNPLKDQDGLPPLAERMAASRRFATDPRIKVTGFEAALGTPYTYETLRYVTRRFPGVHFVWVMGADNLAGFDRWQRWRDIARLVPMAVVDRPGWRLQALASPARPEPRPLPGAGEPCRAASHHGAARLDAAEHPAIGGFVDGLARRARAGNLRKYIRFFTQRCGLRITKARINY